MISFAEMMYYAEAEGLLPTREGRINALIKAVRAYPSPTIDEYTFSVIAAKCGINISSLSAKELRRIENSIK